jgi:hypothetical protein
MSRAVVHPRQAIRFDVFKRLLITNNVLNTTFWRESRNKPRRRWLQGGDLRVPVIFRETLDK